MYYSKYRNHDQKINYKILVQSSVSVGVASVLFYVVTVLTFTF